MEFIAAFRLYSENRISAKSSRGHIKMKRSLFLLAVMAVVCSSFVTVSAQKRVEIVVPKDYQPVRLQQSNDLLTILDASVNEVISGYKDGKLKAEEVAATVIDLRDPNNLQTASFRGEEKIYPA